MRILVIGGTSFIGPYVVRNLHQMGHELTVFHRGEHEADLPPEVGHVHSASAGAPVTSFPKEALTPPPEVVLHMFPVGERDADALMRSFRGIARRVVAVSSGDVYRAYGVLHGTETGPLEPLPLTEDAPFRSVLYPYRSASSPDHWMYDYDKILVERAVMADPQLPGTVLRLPMVYGPGDYGHRLFRYLKRMDDRRPAILLEERQARWRFPLGYVENIAHAISLAVTDERAAGRIYNVSEPTTPPTAEWVRRIGDEAGWSGEIIVLPKDRLPPHLRLPYNLEQHLAYDATRIRTELGYKEPVALDEAIERTIAWERAHQPENVEPEKFNYEAEDAASTP